MALIDPKGLLYGERLGDCSDEAQLHWPRLFCASNGYGRIELSIDRLQGHVYASFKKKPTSAQLSKWFHEYQENFLLFIYQAEDGSLWGQWVTSEKYLPRHKTSSDEKSPSPDFDGLKDYEKRYIESRKSKYLSIQRFHKSSELIREFPLGGGIGEGVGVGEEPSPNGLVAAEAAPPIPRPEEFANVWNQERGKDLSKVEQFTDSRRKKTKIRVNAGLTLEGFREVVVRCRGVPFLCGDNDRGWRASYDWLMENDTNIAKVLEGKYDGSSNGTHSTNRDRPRDVGIGGRDQTEEEIEAIRAHIAAKNPNHPAVNPIQIVRPLPQRDGDCRDRRTPPGAPL